ncbi:Fic family protein [Patescibacteria group bacterium]|nr:Fic family protein [Patescibacteria group bacterium]
MFKPRHEITSKILNKLAEIAEIKGMVEKSSLLPAREALLRKTAVVKMAHTSTSIEGNLLNEYQVRQVAEGKPVQAESDQVKEVKNYLSALKKVDSLFEKKKNINRADVLDMHKVVINGLAELEKTGHFRRGTVYIVNVEPDGKEEVAYTPPKASRVPSLIDELTNWLAEAKDLHPVIRAGLFHYQFVTIHPFTDGNGRVARLLTLLHLYQSGWDFKSALVLEDYYNRDRKKYYINLQTGADYKDREGVDLTGWLEYFVEGFLVEAINLKEKVLLLSAAGGKGETTQVLDHDELKIVDFVTTVGQLTSSDAVDILKVPKRTAQEKLRRLVDANILVRRGKGPASYYIIASEAKS